MAQQKTVNERELEILAYWEAHRVFERSLEKEAPRGDFVFYEGPPTANGRPGIHHAEARAFKDCIPRYKTMQGFHVERKGGWDTHGLPVELEVEKELGFSTKQEIKTLGVAAFNAKCRESVWKYLDEWRAFTRRIGYWVDMEHAYVTYAPEYIESLWWVVRQIWDRGLLYQDYRVTPHCPRCETSLSSHELAQGYKDVKDLSVTVKFELVNEPGTFLLAWTTTPWTLLGNVALAVKKNIKYVKVKKFILDQGVAHVSDGQKLPHASGHDEYCWLAKSRLEACGLADAEIVDKCSGSGLVGLKYRPLYDVLEKSDALPHVTASKRKRGDDKMFSVVAADFVTTDEGTGIVHTAVMYGADDFALGNTVGLPKYHIVKPDGTYVQEAGFLAGRLVTDEAVAVDIVKDLAERRLLFAKEKHTHSYPHCWRCKQKVIYYAKHSWYIKMSALRKKLLEANATIHWEPEHLQDGRFGEWLSDVKDWAFSRERYWGTPLPIWVCEACGKRQCIGSFEELRARAVGEVPKNLDPHRPVVDDIVLRCEDEACGKTARRVPDVVDVWFDSGCMPFAQWHYPFENVQMFDRQYPADYIAEAIDQTRGWFYTLLAVAVALGRGAPYKNVVSLGHVLDAHGKKMSKSVGNVVDPMEAMERFGADAVRWYMYAINAPGENKLFDEKVLGDMVRKNFALVRNVVSFYEMYVAADDVAHEAPSTHVLDEWILTVRDATVRSVTASLDGYRITEAVRALTAYIDELSTWYVRRSRERFKGDDMRDHRRATQTLRACLTDLAKLMAPFAPFIAEEVYRGLYVREEGDSVHLALWPEARKLTARQEDALAQMARVRELVTKTFEAREEEKIPVRQVLASVEVSAPEALEEAYLDILKDEVNVQAVTWRKGDLAATLDTNITPELKRLGIVRELVRRANALRKDSELTIEDQIVLFVETDDADVSSALDAYEADILERTRATAMERSLDKAQEKEERAQGAFQLGLTRAS